ncbi:MULTISPECIES: hypothetical protein [Amycolatopsis]|uniref:Uncharacterized protein n=1 Tax=Amycolatopsis albidoflavus TaxID=102226 RepID=A0ABW5I5S1_9PSEU
MRWRQTCRIVAAKTFAAGHRGDRVGLEKTHVLVYEVMLVDVLEVGGQLRDRLDVGFTGLSVVPVC